MKSFSLRLLLLVLACGLCSAAQGSEGKTAGERKLHYLRSVPSADRGGFAAVAKLSRGERVSLSMLEKELQHVQARKDCSDFYVAGLLRLLFLFRESPGLEPAAATAITHTLINFKYWIDEPGRDNMCYWSENHQVLFHSAEYLAGALFPDRVFPNSGLTGREHMVKGRERLMVWLSWREKFGFSEWLSNVYYDEDLYALANVVDFAPDPELKQRAMMALDQLALNLALNSFRGQFRGTSGRTYAENFLFSRGDDVRQALYLLFGVRPFTPDLAETSRSGVALATSGYEAPEVLQCIAADTTLSFENYQTHGLHIEEAPEHGLHYDDLESGMFFWGMGMYSHPKVIDLSVRMWKEYGLEDNRFFFGLPRLAYLVTRRRPLGPLLERVEAASAGAYLDGAHTYTWRTPDYMLASALDYRPGTINAQSLIWSATLGPDAFLLVTHPGRTPYFSPDKWTGNGANPRVAQYRNLLVAIYNAPLAVSLGETMRYPYTHGWFPRAAFDETAADGHWFFARKADGYAALYSREPVFLVPSTHPGVSELVAPGLVNVWICEMGSKRENGSFAEFMARLKKAAVEGEGTRIRFASPSRGLVEFDWRGPFRVAGEEIPLYRNLRYDSPFIQAPRFSPRLTVRCGGHRLELDFAAGTRRQ